MVQVIDYEKVENCDGQKALEVVDNLLRMNSYETSDLIHEYYLRRYYQQQNIENMPHGQLTVRCGFTEDNNLEVNYFFCLETFIFTSTYFLMKATSDFR